MPASTAAMRFARPLVFALAILTYGGASISARTHPARPESTDATAIHIEADPRLEVPVTLDATGIQLDELLSKYKTEKLILTADRSCAAQKLQVHLKQSSLRALMRSLADLLPGVWTERKDSSGYDISLEAAAAKRRQEWRRLFESEHEASLQSYRNYILTQMRALANGHPLDTIRLGWAASPKPGAAPTAASLSRLRLILPSADPTAKLNPQ
ncbi:MAG TPA: hypothetical protein VKT77_07615 [Chthonomonadaceae bacterium]|nr:hypothetical protein [Chthonomonadaceae bacterium]